MMSYPKSPPCEHTSSEKSQAEQSRTLSGDQTNQRRRRGPKRNPHSKLTGPSSDLQSQKAIDADG
jgi:hypothetical protein